VWIFAGVCWRGGVKWEWRRRYFRFFRSLYLPKLHIQGRNYYIVLFSPLLALHWHRNGWPWMTLNGHFVLKSGWARHPMGWRSGFRRKLFGNLQSYAYTVSGNKKRSPGTVLVISVMGLFTVVTRRGSVKPVNSIHTHSSHTCRSLSLMPVENK